MNTKPTKDGTPQKRLNFEVPEELANEFKAYTALQDKTQREIGIAQDRDSHGLKSTRRTTTGWGIMRRDK